MSSLFVHCALLAAVGASLSACDSPVKPAMSQAVASQAMVTSAAWESCASSSQCSVDMGCIDLRCQPKARSRLGDFYAGSGREFLKSKQLSESVASYNQAVSQYEKDGVALPLDLICEQGRALASAQGDPKYAEAAARVLHRCVLGTPAGSQMARSAMESLASLQSSGLDPQVLVRSELADLYLTAAPVKAALKTVNVEVNDDGKASKKKGFVALLQALQSADATEAFGKCAREYAKSASTPLSVALPYSFRYIMDEDDEARDRFVLSLADSPEQSEEPAKVASQCVQEVAKGVNEGLGKTVRDRSRWKSTITVAFQLK